MKENNREGELTALFMGRKDIRKHLDRVNACFRTGDVVRALRLCSQIQELWRKEKKVVIRRAKSFGEIVRDWLYDKKLQILTYLHSMACLCDVFTCILSNFKDELIKECVSETSYFLRGYEGKFKISFADYSDRLLEMIQEYTSGNIKEEYDGYEEEALMMAETDREKIERFNKNMRGKERKEDGDQA